MVFNLVVLLSLVNLGLSAPDPNVAVDVKVNVEDNGGNDCCDEGCIFGGKVYAHKCYLTDTCFKMQCIDGTWKYKGFNEECGHCTFGGEPLVYPFDDLNNTKPYATENNLTGHYIMTQPGFVVPDPTLFGVNGHFTDSLSAELGLPCSGYWTDCVAGVTYHELGVDVTMAITVAGGKTSIEVSVRDFRFDVGPSVVKIPGTSMLIFKHSNSFGGGPGSSSGSTNCISVIGSFGLTVSFCSNDGWKTPLNYPWSYIYAMPALRDDTSTLYGLCNTFTGQNQDYFTEGNGTRVYNWACPDFSNAQCSPQAINDVEPPIACVDALCDSVAKTWKVPA